MLKRVAAILRKITSLKTMPFLPDEREALLSVKGVGKTVVARLEEMGFNSLQQLAAAIGVSPNGVAARLRRYQRLVGCACNGKAVQKPLIAT